MTKQTKTALIAGSIVFLAFGGIFGWVARSRPPASSPAPAPATPQSPTHERASLVEQLQKKPGHTPVLLRLAQLDREGGHPDDARKWLEQAVAADPANVEALLELGRVCYEAGDRDCAQRETRRILANQPNQVDALYNLGAMAANDGRTAEASDLWARAVHAAPESESGKKARDGLQALGFNKR